VTDIHDLVPPTIAAGQAPNGVVIRIYRYRDGAVLRERSFTVPDALFSDADPTVEMLASLDADETWTNAEPAGHRSVVVVGYDGDDGTALSPPMLITDDPAVTGL
jgi:hypothetical protein